ncbi:hypothetical protein [Bradyrhizobium sp. STM 3566]|uniref:hypothetical protein n=1 Tax=Bradyrhizobium sp. STM 3566 TaxID=578928 RepID=UPI00389082E2
MAIAIEQGKGGQDRRVMLLSRQICQIVRTAGSPQDHPSLDLSPVLLNGLGPVAERGTEPAVFLNPNSCMSFEPEPS